MIYVVGVGPGDIKFMTEESKKAIEISEVVIGGSRNLKILKMIIGSEKNKEVFILSKNIEEIRSILDKNLDKNIAVLASGDPLMYGIASFIIREYKVVSEICIISGISSIQLAFSKFMLDMNDVYITSGHGRIPDFDMIFLHKKVAMVTDKKMGPREIAREVLNRGIDYKMYIGENLSYPDERLISGSCEDILKISEFSMSVVILIRE